MSNVCLSVICLILEIIIFILTVVATPIDALRIKGAYNNCIFSKLLLQQKADLSPGTDCPRVCYSSWGIKECGAHKVNPNDLENKGFPGDDVKKMATAAAAFEIISIFVTLLAVIFSILMVCKCMSATVVLIIDIIAVITIIIAIGCLLGVYYKDIRGVVAALLGGQGPVLNLVMQLLPELFEGDKTKVKQLFNLYASVGVIVTAWCLQVITLILMIINACCC